MPFKATSIVNPVKDFAELFLLMIVALEKNWNSSLIQL
tara:strand:- start:319 stop:432 length:114 start_codon:yes stop_codon:yes gene_type:complete